MHIRHKNNIKEKVKLLSRNNNQIVDSSTLSIKILFYEKCNSEVNQNKAYISICLSKAIKLNL